MLDVLGHPERHFPAIHVAGTNGKGSVCALLDAALSAAGLRVGRYTSPHLVDVRERMLVAGRPIPERAFAAWAERLLPDVEAGGASFFEATTALAFADFAARGVDIVVVEAGLGGRLDATNVLVPLVAVVTHIGRDHTEYLGDTLSAIAKEKAGIAKPGVPLVVGERDPEIAAVVAGEGRARGATVVLVPPGDRFVGEVGLAGGHQARNAAVAQAVLRALPANMQPAPVALARGFAGARLAGRFDRRGRWLFDVAHNPAGVEALVAALAAAGPARPVHALVGILGDKEWGTMLGLLGGAVDRLWLTDPPSAPPERRWDLGQERVARAAGGGPASHVERDFARALAQVPEGAGTVLVTGSFHTVGDALARLPGFAPLG